MKDIETRLTALETTIIELKNQENKIAQLEAKVSELTTFISEIQEQFILLPDVTRYGKLKKLLQENDLRGADEETTRIMLEVAGEERDTLTPDDVSNYPCNSIQVIDEIWRKYSNQKFGFSVQLQTYYKAGGDLDSIRAQDITMLKKFADEVGWLDENKVARFEDYEHWNFTLSAPDGCFPAHWWKSPYGLKMVTFFFSRLISCNIA